MRTLVTLLFAYLLTLWTWAEVAAPPATDFIRVERDEKSVKLQTAITRYSKGDVHVDLIGAVHIADEAYYKKLNKTFTSYPVLLFEMIGGENLGQGRAEPAKGKNAEGELRFLSTAFDTMQNMLELSSQKDHIDYSAKNFLHADLTIKEFTELQKKRKESLLSFAIQNSLQADPNEQPNSLGLLLALFSRDSNRLKLQLIDTLAAGDNQIAAISGNNVIITDRNLKCLQVMQKQIQEGKKTIGIFYGAAHFPDMEKRLLKQGFKKTKNQWVDAWLIKKKK